MLGDLMESVQPVEIKIFGSNQEKLNELSSQIASGIENIEGIEDVNNGILIAGPYIDIIPDPVKLAQFNITPVSFQFQLQTMMEGNVVSSIPEREQLTNIRMIYPNSTKNSLGQVKDQFIFLPGGKLKPLQSLASFNIKEGVAQLKRENLESMSIVTARLNRRDIGSAMKEIRDIISSNFSLPQGYHIEYGGIYAGQQRSFNELLTILILACLLVFVLMLFLFRDFRASFTILLIAISGLSGSLIALFITGTPLNVEVTPGLHDCRYIGENALHIPAIYDKQGNGSVNHFMRPGAITAALLPLTRVSDTNASASATSHGGSHCPVAMFSPHY
jgi:Cu/Ag efflux pump CusA